MPLSALNAKYMGLAEAEQAPLAGRLIGDAPGDQGEEEYRGVAEVKKASEISALLPESTPSTNWATVKCMLMATAHARRRVPPSADSDDVRPSGPRQLMLTDPDSRVPSAVSISIHREVGNDTLAGASASAW